MNYIKGTVPIDLPKYDSHCFKNDNKTKEKYGPKIRIQGLSRYTFSDSVKFPTMCQASYQMPNPRQHSSSCHKRIQNRKILIIRRKIRWWKMLAGAATSSVLDLPSSSFRLLVTSHCWRNVLCCFNYMPARRLHKELAHAHTCIATVVSNKHGGRRVWKVLFRKYPF